MSSLIMALKWFFWALSAVLVIPCAYVGGVLYKKWDDFGEKGFQYFYTYFIWFMCGIIVVPPMYFSRNFFKIWSEFTE